DQGVREACAARRDYALRVLVDDVGGSVPAGIDVVWNPNAYGMSGRYIDFTGPVLTGAGHVPVRPDLPKWRGGDPGTVAVTIGGGEVPRVVRDAFKSLTNHLPGLVWLAQGSWALNGWVPVDAARPWDDM